MRLLRSTLALAGLSAAYGLEATPIQMEVLGGETRCLADTVRADDDTTFEFRAVPKEGTSIDDIKVVVEHPNGIEPYVTFLTEKNEEHRVESDQGEGGYTYKVCFQSLQPTGSRTRVELKETTVKDEDTAPPYVPKHLMPVHTLLQHAKRVADSLNGQLEEGAKSENKWIDSDRVLRSRINMVAAFTIVVLLSVSGWQLALLNRFFRSKKLI